MRRLRIQQYVSGVSSSFIEYIKTRYKVDVALIVSIHVKLIASIGVTASIRKWIRYCK